MNLDPEQCPRFVLERSKFYNDYLQRIGAAYSMGAVIARSHSQAPTLTALRGRRKDEFGEAERKIAKFLLPHLARAWTVCEKLELLAGSESVLDKLSAGIVFLAAGGLAIYCNDAAEEIIHSDDGLTLRNGALCASDRLADAQLRKAIDHALSPERPTGRTAVTVQRPSMRRAYQIVVAPLRGRFRQFAGMAAPLAVVFIIDPERQNSTSTDLLIQLYGLTPKEAALSARLSEGESIEQAAETMGMKYQTATLQDYVDRVIQAVDASKDRPILVGHGMGLIGLIGEAVPDSAAALVYVAALIPPSGLSMMHFVHGFDPRYLAQFQWSPDRRTALISPEGVRDFLYACCPPEIVESAIARFTPEPVAPFETPFSTTQERFGRVPRYYIECLRDRVVPIALQGAMRADLPFDGVYSLDTDHAPFFSAPEELATILRGITEKI